MSHAEESRQKTQSGTMFERKRLIVRIFLANGTDTGVDVVIRQDDEGDVGLCFAHEESDTLYIDYPKEAIMIAALGFPTEPPKPTKTVERGTAREVKQ